MVVLYYYFRHSVSCVFKPASSFSSLIHLSSTTTAPIAHCPTLHTAAAAASSLRPAPFSCTKPGIIEGGNATVSIFGGVGGEEGEDWGVAAVPQDDEAAVQHRSTATTEGPSSHKPFLGEQRSSADATHDSVSTQGVDAGGHHDGTGSTQGERAWDVGPQ